MELWTTIAMIVHVLIALAIIGLVLLQHGKGADMGSGFGSGASGSLFGATGSANFLSRTTAVLATLFFIISLALAYLASTKPRTGGVLDAVKSAPAQSAPTAPASDIPTPAAGAAPASDAGSKAKDVPN
ncbi:MAG: preprotein translocase subunit SecG [Burkholderiales bacterium]|nr:preprotein translocase subunit SecG [Burkholderiales bacterium]